MCTSKSLGTYELKTLCWASNHQNNCKNGPKAHFPFNLLLFGDLCQHTKKQLKVQHHSQKCRFEDQIFSLEIWHIWITFATTWFIFTNQILFLISKSNTLVWANRDAIPTENLLSAKTPPFPIIKILPHKRPNFAIRVSWAKYKF
jgi:hypothetical protein